jgi:hypothetical protein
MAGYLTVLYSIHTYCSYNWMDPLTAASNASPHTVYSSNEGDSLIGASRLFGYARDSWRLSNAI